jgi:D-threo-aldose 1-dehydrogenase
VHPSSATRAERFDFGRLSYGTASLGNLFEAVSDADAGATLESAWELGIRYFDTAPHYGLGLAERRLGEFLGSRPRGEFVVSTKAGRLLKPTPERAGERDDTWFDVSATARRIWDFSPTGIRRSLEDSLQRLGLDRIDILYLHDPEQHDDAGALGDALEALVRLREDGLVAAVGVGSADVGLLLGAIDRADLDLLMISNRYTLLDHSAGAELAPACLDRGIGIVTAGVFNSGLLASPVPDASSHYDYGPVPTDVLNRARRLAAVCSGWSVELPAAALQYSLLDPAVTTVVVGAGSARQLRENHTRMSAAIPAGLWAELRHEGLIA